MKRVPAIALAVACAAAVTSACVATSLASTSRITLAPVPGEQKLYEFTYAGEGVDRPGAVFASASDRADERVSVRVSGVLVETVVGRDARGTTVVWNLIDPAVRYDGGAVLGDALAETALHDGLAHPIVERSTPTGAVASVVPDDAAKTLGADFVRGVLSRLEVVRPERPSAFATSWRVDEPDASGSRASTYTLDRFLASVSGEPAAAFHRTSFLVRTPDARSRVSRPAISALAQDDGSLALDGTLDVLHAFDVQTVTFGGRTISRSQTRIDLTLLSRTELDVVRVAKTLAFAAMRLASAHATGLDVERSDRQIADSAARSALGNETEATLARDLARIVASGDARALPHVTLRLAALFYREPRTIARFADVARSASDRNPAFDAIAAALAQCGTPRAIAAIATLAIARERDARAGPQLAMALGLQTTPTARSVAVLERIADDGRGPSAAQAELALGSIARTLHGGGIAGDDALTARIVDRLDARLAAATGADTRHVLFSALGNAASDRAFPAIVRYRGDASPDVRAGVATALRAIESARADDALGALLADKSPAVRLAAASAFEHRIPADATYAVLARGATSDADATVRVAATIALWNTRVERPAADALVREIATSDADQNVRTAARHAIDGERANDNEAVAPDARLRGE